MYDVSTLVAEPLLLEPLRRSVDDGTPPLYLRSAKIKLTARCNLKCIMCRYGRGWTPPEMATERFLEVIDELADTGCRKIHFSGGEVLVRSDFEQLVGRAARRDIKITLTSNLTLLTKDRAKELMRHKISSVSTSLDGATAKTHESVRGIDGSFKRTLRGMALLAKERQRRGRRTRVRVNYVMMRQNFRDYPALIKLAHEHGAVEVKPMPVDTKSDKVRLSKRLIREYNEDIAPRVAEARQRAGMSLDDRLVYPFGRRNGHVKDSAEGLYAGDFYRTRQCYAPWLHLFIAWDGEVFLCCMTNSRIDPLGDLNRQSVGEIYRGAAFQQIRARMKAARIKACHHCDMYLEENELLDRVLVTEEQRAQVTAKGRRYLPLVG